ncbi:MAG: hypothetical protein U9Q90_04975 [Campylobacterota bacterium]|nr:hypothetical protein [Campylobacterota bacterium]
MKKVLLAAIVALAMVSGAYASEGAKASAKTVAPTKESPVAHAEEATFEKEGFLTTKWCAEQGLFVDCRMESIVCGEGGCFQNWEFGDKMKTELVVFVHDDLQYYQIKPTEHFEMAELIETGINRNLVTIKGKYDAKTNTILATEFKAPPPPKKSFFKGCL